MNSQELLDSVRNEQNPMSILIGALNLLKKENGFEQDLLTPGFIKEWMVSEILGHECHKTKHGADAYSKDGLEKYEYLTCKEGGSFQLDRIHKDNLHRIERNTAIFFALFDKEDGLECKSIWKCETSVFLAEVTKNLKTMSESSKHVSVGKTWVEKNCEKIYGLDLAD